MGSPGAPAGQGAWNAPMLGQCPCGGKQGPYFRHFRLMDKLEEGGPGRGCPITLSCRVEASVSPPLCCRPPQDISLEEFDDEDLSEITDDCGIGLNYDSDHYEKDCLVLERCEQPHPTCTFQDDFQEFEMIDDNEEEEEEEEEGGGGGDGLEEAPPSPSASPIPSPTSEETQKHRPTTLNLTVTGTQWRRACRTADSRGHRARPLGAGHQAKVASRSSGASHVGEPPPEIGPKSGRASPFLHALHSGMTEERSSPRLAPPLAAAFWGLPSATASPPQCEEDSLNNNSRCPPVPRLQRATWQETLLHSTTTSAASSVPHTERPSPSHPCLQDGLCLGMQGGKGPAPALAPCKPPPYDAEGNGREGPLSPARPGEDYNMNIVSSVADAQLASAPSGQVPAELPPGAPKGPEPQCPHSSPPRPPATESYCARFQRDVGASPEEQEGAGGSVAGRAGRSRSISAADPGGSLLSDEEPGKGHSDAGSGGCRAAGAHRSPAEAAPGPLSSEGEGAHGSRAPSVRGLPSASSDTTSPSSDPGIEADLTSRNSKGFPPRGQCSEDLSSPGSDSDVDGELEAAFAGSGGRLASNMISSISETELDLSSDSSSGRSSHLTNSIEEASSPGSEADLEGDLEAQGVLGLKGALLLDTAKDEEGLGRPPEEGLTALKIEECFEDPSAPVGQTEVPLSGHLELEINPDHSLESLRRSFYLPVGPKLMPEGDDEDEGNSESDSESDSESEPDVSEDSDSPWLLSNLVNKMISEGSYPIKCADERFPATHSLADTISPASDLEPELHSEALSEGQPRAPQSIELVDMETLRTALQCSEDEKRATAGPVAEAEAEPPAGRTGPCLFLSNMTNDTITPVFPGRPLSGCCGSVPGPKGLPPREAPGKEEPAALPEDCEIDGDLDSGILGDSDMIDDIRLERGEGLDVSTAQTNRGFSLAYSPEEEEAPSLGSRKGSPFSEELPPLPPALVLDSSLAYDSVKYTLVVDENTQLELVSLQRCTSVLSDDSDLLCACDDAPDLEEVASDFGEGLGAVDGRSSSSEDSSPEADLHFSKKFLNVFVNSTTRSSSTESFGLFSCLVNGEEREQTHRAVFRFIPRHEDELELDVDDPILVELEEDDYWYRGYNMRTGEWGIFPAFYAHEVASQAKGAAGLKRNPCWVERFNVQFLGSVEVPHHQGNGILCAAMQKIATTRKLTVHLRPPATCDLEVSLQGIKLILTVNEYGRDDERCSHFFQMKNISFCGCHPRNSCYFGFITKHPVLSRFACHVFVSQESMRHVAECVGRAFQEYYQEHLEFACPTEDIYLE
ncbi:C-Jun-amino-terminal kinase-interacting protein 2 [Varanus komodoensis]|uniref:C-Jun-amino-terminal kinase-interacting protein 2 n=1 Tax=Varanus komodoensis TaxID=61221 RepID=UPI001CF77B25|nr:C-Jun-amino-terminal kinase-interacting protein 2 [Varanus komodoensis]